MYANTSLTLNGITYTFASNGVCQNVGSQPQSPGGSAGVSTGGPGSSSSGSVSTGGPGSSSGNGVSYESPGSSSGSPSSTAPGNITTPGGSGSSNSSSGELVPFLTTGPKKDT